MVNRILEMDGYFHPHRLVHAKVDEQFGFWGDFHGYSYRASLLLDESLHAAVDSSLGLSPVSPLYFQGTTVTGPVRASVARTFREVVDAFRICPTLPLTRDAFQALSDTERNKAKQQPFFVPAVFKSSPSKRSFDEATHCNLIFLDIDPEKVKQDGKWVETGRFPAAPFVHHPESLYTALAGFNFAAHLTASSTPQKPRMRIVVDAREIPLESYSRAALRIGALLGLPSITRESRVAVQPMYLPVMFSDSSEADHPLIAHSLEGRPFTEDDIGDAAEPQSKGSNGSSRIHPVEEDPLYFLRAPIPEITLGTAKEALQSIDPDISRSEWLEVAAALKHQYSPKEEDAAFDLFDEWSSAGTKYGGTEETQALWDSLRPTPVGRMPVTIRTLLRVAVSGGWDDRRVKDKSFNELVSWMEVVITVTELMENGIKRILSAPILSHVQEAMLVDELRKHARKRFGYSVSATTINKDLNRLKEEIKAQSRSQEKTREPLWAKGVCYVGVPQEFYRHRTGERYKAASFDASYGRWLLPSEEQLRDSGIAITAATLSKPIVLPSDYALNHLKIPAVYDYAYAPDQPTEMFFAHRGRKYVNTYSPTYPEPDTKNAVEAGNLLQTHLVNLVLEQNYRETLTDFMAFMVQCPGRKIRWAVLIQSVEGAGKTFLAQVMRAVLGKEHVRTIGGETISKGWNEWAFGKQLVVLEEVRAAGTNRHATMNALKPVISNDEIAIDQRNRDTREAENCTNYMLFSNHHDALALTPGDRRYFVIKSPLQDKSQVLALGEDYFPRLFGMLRDKPGALRSYLAQWEISPDFKADGHAPRTKYVQELINDSANSLTAAVRRLVAEADYPLIQNDIVSAREMIALLSLEDGLGGVTSQQLAQVLREEGFRQIGRHKLGEDRHYLWMRGEMSDSEAIAEVARRVIKNIKKTS